MIKIQCIGRRRLDIQRLEDGNWEVKIMLTGPETRIATLIIPPWEFDKFMELWSNYEG